VRLENDRRRGKIDDRRYAARREELIAALEQVYSALDSHDVGPEPPTPSRWETRGGDPGPAGRAGLAA
jgi:hypothetical protein